MGEPAMRTSLKRTPEPEAPAASRCTTCTGLKAEARSQHEKRGKDATQKPDELYDFYPHAAFHPVAKVTRPPIRHDHGFLDDGKGNLDPTKRRPATASDYLARAKWTGKLVAAETLRPDLSDATATYRHFLNGGGAERPFSYDSYAENDLGGARTVDSAMQDARRAAVEHYTLTGETSFTLESDPIGVNGSNPRYPYPGTENWQKAIGAHSVWVETSVKVGPGGDGTRTFTMDTILHAEDRYNFNQGASDIATGIADAENGRFEQTGLGNEFMSTSTLKREMKFTSAPTVTPELMGKPADLVVTKKR